MYLCIYVYVHVYKGFDQQCRGFLEVYINVINYFFMEIYNLYTCIRTYPYYLHMLPLFYFFILMDALMVLVGE
jgi:hypothetical protein